MYYRTHHQYKYISKLGLQNYLTNEKTEMRDELISDTSDEINEEDTGYDFDNVMDYYDNRKEYKIVGIVDKETNRRKTKRHDDVADVFKIREKR